MLGLLYQLSRYAQRPLWERIYRENDAYGEVGTIPVQGLDWSGVRDSSPQALERMFSIATRALAEVR
jgi:hypothetical protein